MNRLVIRDEASFRSVMDTVCGSSNDAYEQIIAEKTEATKGIVEAVRLRGDAAVAEYTERFDGVKLMPEAFEVSDLEMDTAFDQVDAELLATMRRAYDNIYRFHEKSLQHPWEETLKDGTVIGQRITPIQRVGIYVPGGRAFYPSTVMMNIAPAKVAGVEEIVMVSPPSWNGSIHPTVLAAAKLAGATRVFRIGGAQAIAALAYGTEHIPQVLKITGPGNTFVAVAKRLVQTHVDIDTEAGPSEVLVLADDTADPRFVAAEMLAQAEHDPEACSVLVTTDPALAEKVEAVLDAEISKLSRAAIIRQSLAARGAIVTVPDMDWAIRATDYFAPEHLSIQTRDPRSAFDRVRNAGAAMLGPWTPVAVGDYFAGPNHTLPTGRRARYASPLTAEAFRKVTSIIEYSEERLRGDAADIRRFAEAEELTAHARSIEVRL